MESEYSSNDLLEQLLPIIAPEHDVSWWPLAPGWWLLMTLIVTGILLWRWLRPILLARQAEITRWESAYHLLENIYLESCSKADPSLARQNYLQESNTLFKRIVHHYVKDSTIASSIGSAWVNYLRDIYSPDTEGFEYLYGQHLYAKSCEENIRLEDLHSWAKSWLISFQKKSTSTK